METEQVKGCCVVLKESGVVKKLNNNRIAKTQEPIRNNLKKSIEKWAQSRGLHSSTNTKKTITRAESSNFDKVNTNRTLKRRSRSACDIRKHLNKDNNLSRKRTENNLAPIPSKVKTLQSKGGKANCPKVVSASASNNNENHMKLLSTNDYRKNFYSLLKKHKLMIEEFEEAKNRLSRLDALNLPNQLEETRNDLCKLKKDIEILIIDKEKLEAENKIQTIKIYILDKTLQTTNEQQILHEKIYNNMEEEHKNLTVEVKELRSNYDILTKQISTLNSGLIDYQEQLFYSDLERKKLLNEVLDLHGNIRVFCRVRPQLSSEIGRKLCSLTYTDDQSIEISNKSLLSQSNTKLEKHIFGFDYIFHPKSSQSDIFHMVSPLIQSALDGYNACIFAYGQPGSGKTYTMVGDSDNLGIIPRTIDYLFESIQNYKRAGWEFKIRVSFVEICNEFLCDLLSKDNNNQELDSNITEEVVTTQTQLRDLLQISYKNRAKTVTAGSKKISRTHSVIKIQLNGFHERSHKTCIGIINLVDLGYSEDTKIGKQKVETKKINRTQSELTNIILAVSQNQKNCLNTNSKLVHFIMPSLAPNSKILMFINLSPLLDCYGESIKLLRFAEGSCKLSKAKQNKTLIRN